ncbi:SAF domain-containing protein, partial [Nocardioides sp. YIM 152588]|uniref:SAF domain-containing protein n=1 Tax=Nocardioides sp. YIM 152588 TaxID=3158259 RepID=UPI0032E3930E
ASTALLGDAHATRGHGLAVEDRQGDATGVRAVAVAARDLPAGARVEPGDLDRVGLPPDAVPDGVVEDPTGVVLAAPLRRGEPVTDVRVVGPGLAAGATGRVAVPVRLSDADQAGLLAAGDRIDVLATDPAAGTTAVVAVGVTVLAVPPAGVDGGAAGPSGLLGGRLVVLGVAAADVQQVTSAGALSFVTFAWAGG